MFLSELLLEVTPHSGTFALSELLLGVSPCSDLLSALLILRTISGKGVQWGHQTRLLRNLKRRPLHCAHSSEMLFYVHRM